MRHDLALRGHAFGLRPVERDDASFIVSARANAEAAGYLNRGAATEAEQRTWLDGYFERAGDYYFVVHALDDATREGLVGVYDVSSDGEEAEWGRWVLREGSVAAIESALLVYRAAFEHLGLKRLVARTLADNAAVVSFHDSCGVARTDATVTRVVAGRERAVVEHLLDRQAWPSVAERLEPLARRVASRVAARAGKGRSR